MLALERDPIAGVYERIIIAEVSSCSIGVLGVLDTGIEFSFSGSGVKNGVLAAE